VGGSLENRKAWFSVLLFSIYDFSISYSDSLNLTEQLMYVLSFLLDISLYSVTDVFYYFQVCGLKWSPNGRLLARGGDDNTLHIWPAASGLGYSHPKPLFSFR
jgi:WD40 repeat protein